MKTKLFLLSILFLSLFACKKESIQSEAPTSTSTPSTCTLSFYSDSDNYSDEVVDLNILYDGVGNNGQVFLGNFTYDSTFVVKNVKTHDTILIMTIQSPPFFNLKVKENGILLTPLNNPPYVYGNYELLYYLK